MLHKGVSMEAKVFRIDEGGERFYYAAQDADQAKAEYRETWEPESEDFTIVQLSDEEMEAIKITREDEEGDGGLTTLKALFEEECKGWTGEALYLAGSVF